MKDKETFEYTYYAPSEQERREIEEIRKKYVTLPASAGIDELKRLDHRVGRLGVVVATILGLLGVVIFVAGLILCLQVKLNANYLWGLAGCGVGLLLLASAFPMRQWMNRWSRKRYGPEILKLSETILKSERSADDRSQN